MGEAVAQMRRVLASGRESTGEEVLRWDCTADHRARWGAAVGAGKRGSMLVLMVPAAMQA